MTGKKRISLAVSYDGTCYHGWQSQTNLLTIQHSLEKALSQVANHPVRVVCAGRTDAGVHATSQIVHFDTKANRSDQSWVLGANTYLPADISVLWSKEVNLEFHARFSATARKYRYILFNHKIRPGILRNSVGWYYKPLDEILMREAAHYLMGKHDFSAFRGTGCQAKDSIRTIHNLNIVRKGKMLILEVEANAFLMHMVRNIVGMLIAVGDGTKSPEWANQVLESRDRQSGGVTIEANGLYLVGVDYPSLFNLPKTLPGPFFLE